MIPAGSGGGEQAAARNADEDGEDSAGTGPVSTWTPATPLIIEHCQIQLVWARSHPPWAGARGLGRLCANATTTLHDGTGEDVPDRLLERRWAARRPSASEALTVFSALSEWSG